MCVSRGCWTTRAEGGQWQSHGPLRRVAIRRRETRADGRGGRGISHLLSRGLLLLGRVLDGLERRRCVALDAQGGVDLLLDLPRHLRVVLQIALGVVASLAD